MTKELDPDLVRRLLRYEPETGRLFWRERFAGPSVTAAYAARFNARFAGKEAFTARCGNGYLQGHLLSHKQLAHRMIWTIVYGQWPVSIDHIDGDRANNRLSNLREVTHAENCLNLAIRSDNKTGHIGIRWTKGAYQASITIGGERKYLGRFANLDEAIEVRRQAQAAAGFHPNHGRAA